MSCVLIAERKSSDVIKKYINFTLKILPVERVTCMEDYYHLPPDDYQDDERHNLTELLQGSVEKKKQEKIPCRTSSNHHMPSTVPSANLVGAYTLPKTTDM
jgi:hypothetical protein